jgi:ArsR family transcriptional regulator, arsenate/arsenite/antimonite-responsive transcriptional repressor
MRACAGELPMEIPNECTFMGAIDTSMNMMIKLNTSILIETMASDLTVDGQLKALGDPVRMRIVRLLSMPLRSRSAAEETGGFCACDIESVIGIGQSTVSHHMKHLQQCDLVHSEKKGRWVYYRINQTAFANLSQALARFAGDQTAASCCDTTDGSASDGAPAKSTRLSVIGKNKSS